MALTVMAITSLRIIFSLFSQFQRSRDLGGAATSPSCASPQVCQVVGEVDELGVSEVLDRGGHNSARIDARTRLVVAQGLDEIIVALMREPRIGAGAREIGVVAGGTARGRRDL